MFQEIRPALVSFFLLSLLTGVIYPVTMTGAAQLLFPSQANGSLLQDAQGTLIGSQLIGQSFTQPRYFWGRLSATAPVPYTSFNRITLTGSSGSNYGPLNPALADAAQQRATALKNISTQEKGLIPVDLLTASASGLDPEISPAAAEFQVARVAAARGLQPEEVRKLVQLHTQPRQWNLFGEPRVNVLQLNLALNDLKTK